jgi:hypothetical protein
MEQGYPSLSEGVRLRELSYSSQRAQVQSRGPWGVPYCAGSTCVRQATS